MLMVKKYGPFSLLKANEAVHEFLHKDGQVNELDRFILYKIKHFEDTNPQGGVIVRWQWKDVQEYVERHKKGE